jgi:16S rRNA (cytosine1402-N4)-methyltransferase
VHISVLLQPILESLLPCARLVDGTLGAGGHSAALLAGGAGALLGLDKDSMALGIARAVLTPYAERVHLVHSGFDEMTAHAHALGWQNVDAVLLDLGVSSMQLDRAERGFSFRHDAPLDMRLDAAGDTPTAATLVNEWDEHDLVDIFFRYGEEPNARRLARAIIAARPLHTTLGLASVIERATPRRHDDKIHPATRVFQALRIAVNDELGILQRTLPQAIDLLSPKGKLAVISFHSLEDRIVKDAFKLASTGCICPPKIPICVCGHTARVGMKRRSPPTHAVAAQNSASWKNFSANA